MKNILIFCLGLFTVNAIAKDCDSRIVRTDQDRMVVATECKIKDTKRAYISYPKIMLYDRLDPVWSSLRSSQAGKICKLFGYKTLISGSEVVFESPHSFATKLKNPVQNHKEINKAFVGMLCSNELFDSDSSEERMTSTGAIFKAVDDSDLGESWLTPDGTIWADVTLGPSSHEEAVKHCEDKGARLPNSEDFLKLTSHFGSVLGTPQILPNLRLSVWMADKGSDPFGTSWMVMFFTEGSSIFHLSLASYNNFYYATKFNVRCLKDF